MKLTNIDSCIFKGNEIIYLSEDKQVLIAYDVENESKRELALPIKVNSCKSSSGERIHLSDNSISFLYDYNFELVRICRAGVHIYTQFYKSRSFLTPYIAEGNALDVRRNVIFDEETKIFTPIPIETDILDYVFHEQYFIPVTYPYAFKDHVYGPEVTLYNYKAEVIWTKDFRNGSTYVNSLPQFRENERVSVTNIKVWGDKLLISTSTQHLLCYNIHTGQQIWAIDNFGSTHVHLVAFDSEEGTGFVVCSGEEGVFWSLYKVDLIEGRILAEKPIREWEHSGFSNLLTSWTLTDEGLWTATQFTGKIGRMNRDTLEIDLVYQIEEVRGIAQRCAPHITKEFVMIEDGWRNLEIIKR